LRRTAFSTVAIGLTLSATISLLSAQTSQTNGPKSAEPLTIRDLWKQGGLTGRVPETVKWSPDGTKVSYVLRDEAGERGELWYIDTTTGKPAVLVAAEKLAGLAPPNTAVKDPREQERRSRYGVAGYHWAPDSKHLLFDSKGQLWYFSLDTGTATQMTSSSEAQQDPKFSPDGRFLSYVKKHQLFVRDVEGKQEREKQVTKARDTASKQRVADAGNDDKKLEDNILNGEVDWVYAEELGVRSNYFWSPDSKNIAFLQMDESDVPVYPIEDFITKHATVDEQKYPKAGDSNPAVRVGVVGRDGGRVKWVTMPGPYEYISRFGWVNDHVVYAALLNRAQNQFDLVFADVRTGQSKVVMSDKADPFLDSEKQMIEMFHSGDRFLWSSWRDGNTHLYLYSFDKNNPLASEAKLEHQVTKGDFEVSEIDAVDEANGIVYYESNEAPQGGDQFAAWRGHGVIARKFDGTQVWTDVSGWRTASFADNGKYFVETSSNYGNPPQMRFCVAQSPAPKCNEPFFQSKAVTYPITEPQWQHLKAEDGTELEAMLLLPDVPQGQKVPVILNPYGGPGGQQVVDKWGGSNAAFDQILLRDGFAILRVDNRGMGARGRKFTSALYRNMGEVELKDQLSALDQVLQQYPQLDGSRVGWWGWSYGGYMTLYAMTHSDRIKAGVSVAPVTNWELYDTVYTERYMRVPKENAEGYRKSSPVSSAANLHGRLLEVHGTSDDNVHMQNSVQMIQAFIDADKQYSLLLYPRKTHGIAGEAARTHLFERIEQHFLQYLK
jgi:dipeptidyl-peptidase-4